MQTQPNKKPTVKLSIVTVCYNSEKTLEDCILSVLTQSYGNIEYVVVDGNSTDETQNIIAKYKDRIDTIICEPDDGIYDAMNKGINSCTGDIIGILNSDDVYASKHELSNIAKCFSGSPHSEIVLGNIEFHNFETGKVIRTYSAKYFEPYKLRFGWIPPHPACFVRKRVYEKYGLYCVDFKIAADYERFVHWLYVQRLSFAKIDRTIVKMSLGGASTANIRSTFTLNKEVITACKNNGLYTNILFLLSKYPFKILEFLPRKPKQA